jgi:hypothetical protein
VAGTVNPTNIAGRWTRVGPYTVNMTDGTLNVTTTGGILNIAGLEVRRP